MPDAVLVVDGVDLRAAWWKRQIHSTAFLAAITICGNEIAWHTGPLNEPEGKSNVCSYMDRPRKDGGAHGAPSGGGWTRRSRFRHRSCRRPRGRSSWYPRLLVARRRRFWGGCRDHDAARGTTRAQGTGGPQRVVLGRLEEHSFCRFLDDRHRSRRGNSCSGRGPRPAFRRRSGFRWRDGR